MKNIKWVAVLCLKAFCFAVIYLLAFSACDLFEGDPDFIKKIDAEIIWANAPKLNVTLSAPGSWGNGSVKSKKEDVRMGYDFEIEFNVMPGFSIVEWRAYKTKDIENFRIQQLEKDLSWNWLTAPNPFELLVNAEIEHYKLTEWKKGDDKNIELRSPRLDGGGIFNFRINIKTKDQIVFIPLCNNAPGIRLTHPPMKEEGASLDTFFPPAETITIDLTAPIDQSTAILEENYIEILTWDLNANGEPEGDAVNITKSRYFTVRWNAGLWRIIIEPTVTGVSAIENKMIMVVLGEEIKNIMGESLVGINNNNKSISFSWKTKELITVNVTKLEAGYDEKNKTITIDWTLSARHSVVISYTENNTQRQFFESETGISGIAEIKDVKSLNTGGVRNGQEINNIQRYNIWIQ